MARKIGIDLGGSWVRVGIFDPSRENDPLHVEKYASPGSWDRLVGLIAPHVTADVLGVGVAVAGPIEHHSRVVKGPNLHWLDGRDVGNELCKAVGKRVVVSNDMEAATEGEMARGVLQEYSWAIFDTISTGWGGNLVLAGKRVDGEPGHTNIRFDSPYRCGCGNYGCNEAHYSGSHMEQRIHEHVPRDAEPWQRFQEAIQAEAAWALALLEDWGEGVGRAWANVLNRIRPIQAIVYMGTTAETLIAIPLVARRLRETIQRISMFPEHKSEAFPIVKAQEPNRAIYGAIAVFDKICC